MNRHKQLLLTGCLLAVSTMMMGQGARNIKLSEVMTSNTASIVDEYGEREAWVELANHSYSSYDVRGMFLTTDRSVLDRNMSAPERIKRMSIIPNGEEATKLGANQHLIIHANSAPSKGKLHLALPIDPNKAVWIALYNGNATELIDSVTIPAMADNQSYAMSGGRWSLKAPDNVTPGTDNFITASESKIDRFKREDPHGFAMTIMAMGIVFTCLALLWLFFTIFGAIMRHLDTAKKVAHHQPMKPITVTVEKTIEIGHKTGNMMVHGMDKKGIDMEVYMAVIGMAIKQYEEDVHDVESGVITIRPKDTEWAEEYPQMTHMHEPFIPSTHKGQRIPTTPELH